MDRLALSPLAENPAAADVEIVERKGIGHPDTICDALAEELSVAICRYEKQHFGTVLHHNVDKVLLVAGRSEPKFGGGVVRQPIEIFLAGRAVHEFRGEQIPVSDLAHESARAWLSEHLPNLDVDRHVQIHCMVGPSATELVGLFDRGPALANDTSCGAGFAPMTPLERAVLATEVELNSTETRDMHPSFGEDVKVMGVRRGADVHLTVAVAMVDKHLKDLHDYQVNTTRVAAHALDVAQPILPGKVDVHVNNADDLERGQLYLTVTGTSGESGDDGEAGRGNRASGLITPHRPMTMESLAGKNPITHVGKLYNVLAQQIAAATVERIEAIEAAQCYLVSRIGQPLDQPQLVEVRVYVQRGRPEDHRADIDRIVDEHLAGATEIWRACLERAIRLF